MDFASFVHGSTMTNSENIVMPVSHLLVYCSSDCTLSLALCVI